MKKVQQHYDEVADVYDDRYDGRRGKCYHKHICDHVMSVLPRDGFLLDLGCGTGLFVQRYVEEGGRAVGLDISPGMVRHGRHRCPESGFCVGTADVLPFKDETFNALASLLAFSYVPDPEGMLRECYRVLKPGGRIAICTLSRTVFTSIVPLFYQVGEKVGLKKVGVGDFDEHYYTNAEIAGLFRDAGFEDVSVGRCSFAHLNLADPVFNLARKVEPFVEEKLPYLAYNVCAAGKKPKE
ncbi:MULTISPECIES: methyltransferase domain-containing protein [unclassified Methanoculleus]|uniref:class I SAM-dependent methyltransferase n=1 Tax=unclassified Methanoculleus TaxID=2619537 RepID=UPI0025E6C595|nr:MULTISPECIES: methyltransferase domain-containing protein [unclassified Methanoculleus]MCK9316869.1 methyltransferase domain-containing protein [Methanoculleus sp.]MDD2253931.1 methyltransferase domain-containing protein [Methanoculleus sp.]MDD2787346.1 methyltransferase domain-containing protein [Methanoculleus sp.]MDD3215074.1 methyltransferase domain-containing protein [Methanoculleus sp.]MDD4313087.1 methyltransferase domain-containing protein [Methanoculleus sp.]